MFSPSLPRHLMETDREDEALKVLRKLHYNGSNEEYIQREYHEIKITIAAEKANHSTRVGSHVSQSPNGGPA